MEVGRGGTMAFNLLAGIGAEVQFRRAVSAQFPKLAKSMSRQVYHLVYRMRPDDANWWWKKSTC